MKDFYYILGTASTATPTEIDEAYQKLARKFYPAEGEHDSFLDEHLREITEAYDILRDIRRRRQYDSAFRRSQRKQLAAFRTKYLNIGITIMFLAITALFADYVIRTLRGHPVKKVAIPKPVVLPVAASSVPRLKRHHHGVTQNSSVAAPVPQNQDTATAQSKNAQAPGVVRKMPTDTSAMTLHANITGIIYLHQQPDYNSAVIAKIPDGAGVHIVHKGATWCKIQFNDQTGYVLRAIVDGR